MKKLFSLMMALVLSISLTGTVFATGNTGSITITNATVGDDYTLYKIFDATYGKDAQGNANAVSYSIVEENNPVFVAMFGADGTAKNTYFEYDSETGAVKRRKDTQNGDIIDYLTTLVRENDIQPYRPTVKATNKVVAFTELPYGYYLIDKGVDTDVTITSNTPTINVIDKNQSPAPEGSFHKKVYDEDKGEWVDSASSNIGDIITYKVEFGATNYDGEKQIKYYTIKDTKGEAIWVEFDSFNITVKTKDGRVIPLTKGYYWGVDGTSNTGEWQYFPKNGWTPEEKTNINNAEWFLIHRGFDNFEIVIPWMDNYTFTGSHNDFALTFDEDSKSKFDSPVTVEIQYTASVEPSATIGGSPTGNNLWNRVDLSWTSDRTDGPKEPSIVTTTVYALGLTKIDDDTNEVLAGAEFELYSDADCTKPVYVIPTGVEGVYILDDLTTFVSGKYRETSREKYKDYLEAYLGSNYANTQKNVVTTEENGKLVVLGLEAGDYYLKETKAPDGYNKLQNSATVIIGANSQPFSVVVDENGNAVNSENAVGTQVKHTYICTTTTVENSKGVVLPSTGGEGTKTLITVGTIISIAFAVLLITQKKMSVYQD